MVDEMTPQQKADAAAEALAAEGQLVTARTVQQRARVGMAAAAAAARTWNDREAASRDAPEMPDEVLTRMEGLWRSAVGAARQEFFAEREGWATRIQNAESERDDLAEEIDRINEEHVTALSDAQSELDALRARLSSLETELSAANDAVGESRTAASAAEARAASAEGLVSGLREALAALTPAAEKPKDAEKS